MARATIIVPAAVVAFYVWTAASAGIPFQWKGMKTGYYNLLTEGFLSGHLYVKLDPAPQLLTLPNPYDPVANARYRVHDMSLYHGKYYLYFGPVPVITLFLPWQVITGQAMAEDLATLIYITGGYIFSLHLLNLLLRWRGAQPSFVLYSAAALVLGLGQYGAVVVRNPNMYGTAVGAGYCFFMAGMYCFARLLLAGESLRWLAITAGVLLGLTPGCRPHYVLAALVVCAVYVSYLRARWRDVFWLAVPIAICGLLLLWYNFARFGNPLEFGNSYQLTGSTGTRGLFFRWRNLAPGLYYLLLCPPRLWDQFPFVIFRYFSPGSPLPAENIIGLLALSPLAAAGLVLPAWIGRWKTHKPLYLILAALYAAAIVLMVSVALTGWAVGRYLLDFAPALLVVAMFGLLSYARRSITAMVIVGAIWSTVIGAALSISFNDVLRDRNPQVFRRLARWSGQSAGSIRLPVDALAMTAAITFPQQAHAAREGLLTTGRPGAEDGLVVEYGAENHVRFGLAVAAVGVTFGPEVAVLRGREYRLDISYKPQELVVSLDGAKVGTFPAAFYPTSLREVAVGRGAGSMPDVRPFSGRLQVLPHGGRLSAGGQVSTFE